MFSLTPDWELTGSWTKLEEDIGNGFEFKGPGSYLSDTDTLLILPVMRGDGTQITAENVWHQKQPAGTVFIACCYNQPFYLTALSVLATTPNRVDSRGEIQT
jgi:hypothetical protein